MPEYITTYGGTHFYPTEPKAEDVHIHDIAHALSLICRGNGQVQQFFSVGQHCIRCAREAKARGYSPRMVLACLLHDAGECYLSDVPRPFKKEIPTYTAYEDRILSVIYTKYLGSDLTVEEQKQLKQIDDDLLYFDIRDLLREPQDREQPRMMVEFHYEVEPFAEVEQQYLDLFFAYLHLL